MSRKKNEPFKVVSYIGSELAEFSAGRERPPRSARHVATVLWGWGPAHSHSERWLISSWKRKVWTLWAMTYEDSVPPRRMYKEYGVFTPYHGYDAKFAAERILTAAWKHELELWGSDASAKGARVIEEGLLTQADIDSIEREVFGAEE